MAKIYPGSTIIVHGYVKTVETRGEYHDLIIEVPADSYQGKPIPRQIHKFGVPDSFAGAVTMLSQGQRLTVTGNGRGVAGIGKASGKPYEFTSFRMTDMQPCLDLKELPKVEDEVLPF